MRTTRLRYLIDRQFQFRLVGAFLLLIVASLLVFSTGVAVYYWIRYMAGENLFREFITVQRQVSFVGSDGQMRTRTEDLPPVNRLEIVLPPILINNGIIMVLTLVIGVLYSHRISGPAHRIEADIHRALAGERDVQIRLRRRDKLQRLAAGVNRLLHEFDSRR